MTTERKVDLSEFQSEFSLRTKVIRALWHICYVILFRPSPRTAFAWRRGLLKLFGSKLGREVRIYRNSTFYYPANLEMGDHAIIGDNVNCYNVDKIVIGEHAMVSPFTFLCSASHDNARRNLPLITAPIHIEAEAWVCSDAFIAPGVRVGHGAVVGARACVFKDVPPWTIVGGNPAKYIKDRVVEPSTPVDVDS